jgi:hypothetical protein
VSLPPPDGWPEALTKLRWLRGTYLDLKATFEGILDAQLFEYLAPPADHRLLFYGSVLPRIQLRAKVEMMCDFIDHFDQSSDWDDLKRRLQEALVFRNRCAHAHVQPAKQNDGSWQANIVEWKHGKLRERYRLQNRNLPTRLMGFPRS